MDCIDMGKTLIEFEEKGVSMKYREKDTSAEELSGLLAREGGSFMCDYVLNENGKLKGIEVIEVTENR